MSSSPSPTRLLYHGTGSRYLAAILENGLLPRGISQESQWGHTVQSHPDAVYLSSCYPVHFAINAMLDDDLIIVEVDVSNLSSNSLVADEDALAFCLDIAEVSEMPFLEKARYFRQHLHKYSADFSLSQLGTCAHLGAIPPSAITRIVKVPQDQVKFLIIGGFDETISKVHYEIFGEEYEASIPWLFGDVDSCVLNPKLPKLQVEVICFP